jgi:hypothetical protein
VRVIAEEIGLSDTTPPRLLKSHSFGFGYVSDPLPAHTVQRLEDLLEQGSAYLAYRRRNWTWGFQNRFSLAVVGIADTHTNIVGNI